MNMNTGSDSNNINYSSSKKENVNTSSISTGKQLVKDSIEQYNNTSNYGSVPEIETMDLSFATEQLEENKKTLTDKLKSFFNSLLGREDETSSNVSLDVSSVIKENSKESSIQLPPLESVSSDNDVSSIQLPPLESLSSGNDESSIQLPPLESVSSDNSFEQMDLEYCQIMIDILNEDIEKMKQEYYDLYGNNSSSVAGFKTTYEEDLQSVESAINMMFNQLETMLPIEYINQYFVENYEGEEITYDYLVGLYNEAFINGDVYYQDFFNEIVYGGFSKLQEHDSNLTDESINYLMESEVITLFENIIDKKSYVTDLLAPAVSLAQEIAKLEESKRNFFIYSQSYILEEHEAQTYDYEDFKEFFSDSDLSLMDENYDEARIYVYLYRKGRMDEAKEYRRCLETTLNQRQGWEWAKEWAIEVTSDDANLVSGLLATGGSGTWGGIVNSGMGYYHFLTNMIENDGVMTAEAYKQQFIMTMLSSPPSQESYVMENTDLNSSIIDETQQPVSFVESLFGKESPEYELYTKVQQLDKKYLYNFAYQLGLGFGNLLPTMLLSSSLNICGVSPVVTNWVGIGANTISSFGNEVENNSLNGITGFESYLYAGFSVLSDTALDKLLGGLPVLSNNSGFNLKAFFGEGLNGAVQYVIKGILPRILSGESLDLGDLGNMGKDTLTEFATSVALSVLSNGVQVPINFIVNGVNTMKIIDKNQAMLFCKYDDNGEPYFDSFGFAEYLFGLNSLSNGNNEAAIEHFVNADVWGLVGPENVQQILGSLDNQTLYDILTSSDSDIQSFFLANMSTFELNGLIHDISGFDYTDDDILLLNLHQQIQQSMSVETQEYNAANQEDVTDSTMIEAGEDIFGIDIESINNIEDLKNALNSIDLSKIDVTDSEVIASLRTINEKLNAKGLPSISINGEHFIIDGLDFVSVYDGSVSSENKTSEFIFKILNLPLSDELKLKLIENMSDEDKVKALEYLKSQDCIENVISSIEDKILKYRCVSNVFIGTEYSRELYDQFINDIQGMSDDEIINFVNEINNDYCKSWCLNFLNNQSDLYNIIMSIQSESIKANCLKYLSDENIIVDIAVSLVDERNRAICFGFVSDLSNQCLIAKTLNDDEINQSLVLKVEEELKKRTENIWASKCSEDFFEQAIKEFGIEYCLNYFNPRAWSEDVVMYIKENPNIVNYISDYHLNEFVKFILNNSDFDLINEVLQYINYNPYLLNSFISTYFNENVIRLFGVDRLVEIISYPEIMTMFSSLYGMNNSFSFFCKIVDKLNSYSNDVLYQPYIKALLKLFNEKSYFFDSFCSSSEFEEKMDVYINLFLSLAISDNETLSECIDSFNYFDNSEDFFEKYMSNIESKYNNTSDTEVKKDLFLLMRYGISLEEANNILNTFSLNDDSIFIDESIISIYHDIYNIVNGNTILPDVYQYNGSENISNFFPISILLRQSLINLYSEYYMEHTFKIEEHMPIENRTVSVVDNDGNVVKYDIPCYELDDSSILFIHRKDAFKESSTSQSFSDSDNYYDLYYSCDIEYANNHTLCTSVISNDAGGYVSRGGVIYGYSEWDVSSMALMGYGDLASYNSDFTIETARPELNIFMSIDDLLEHSYSYNEVTFDRNGIDPSCIFIDDTMSQEQLQESYQAAYDWGLPIVYRKQCKEVTL